MIGVDSSHVAAISHDGTSMTVTFRNGAKYRYKGVPKSLFHEALKAPSVGKYLHEQIKPNYAAEKVT